LHGASVIGVPGTFYERAVMMDTSAYLGLREDHQDVILCSYSISATRLPKYVSSTVVAETHRRLLYDHGRKAALDFLRDLYANDTTIVRPERYDEEEAIRILRKYQDLHLTLCDALTFALMLRLGIKRAFTLDCNHFWAIGFTVIPPFDL